MNPADRNTDKYYANKNKGSAFRQSAADSVRKPGQVLKPGETPVVTPVANRDDVSTDKYYAEGGSKRSIAGQPVQAKLPYRAVDPAAVAASRGVVLIEIPDARFLNEGVLAAKQQVAAGNKVEIGVTDKDLIPRVKVALDGAVTREEITEDQRRAIRIGVKTQDFQKTRRQDMPVENRSPDAIFGAPVALGTKEAHTPGDPFDVDAFMAGGAKDEADEKMAAITGGTAEGGRPAPPPVEEEDNDFLSGPPPKPDLSKVPQQPKHPYPDGLDRAVPTDTPVKVEDTEPAWTTTSGNGLTTTSTTTGNE